VVSGWREQYDRMLRWRARLSEPIRQDESRDDYNIRVSDYLHAFFVTCYHVSDALEKDPLAVSAHDQAKNYADTAPWLSKCHGIALGSKHVTIDRGPRKGTSPRIDAGTIKRSEALWGVPSPHGTRIVPDSYFDIEIDGQRHLAFPAVDECVREWDDFLRKMGLLP
jgi:hypothetical protein